MNVESKSEPRLESGNRGDMKKIWLRLGVLLLTVALLVITVLYRNGRMERADGLETESTKYDFAMGTAVSVTVYSGKNGESAGVTAENVIDDIKRLDTDVISWRDAGSELAEVNESAAGETISVSGELLSAVEESYNICVDSEGALDITLRPLLDCWNIENATEENFRVPEVYEIQKSLAETGYEKLEIYVGTDTEGSDAGTVYESNGGTIEKSNDITIDLGATGKGYALDIVRDYLDENNISGAIVTVGGSVMVYGAKSNGEGWKVGIRDPKGSAEDMVGYLEISNVDYMCVSTSGDYEKYVEYKGKRYHHILDRTTGYPAESGLSSVTVMCKSGIDSDGLSTACFVLGEEKSRALLEKYNAEALFIDTAGNITMTAGLEEIFKKQQ